MEQIKSMNGCDELKLDKILKLNQKYAYKEKMFELLGDRENP